MFKPSGQLGVEHTAGELIFCPGSFLHLYCGTSQRHSIAKGITGSSSTQLQGSGISTSVRSPGTGMAPPHTVPTLPELYGSGHGADCTARSPNPGGWEPAGPHSPTSFLLGGSQSLVCVCSDSKGRVLAASALLPHRWAWRPLLRPVSPWLLAPGTEPRLTPKSSSADSYTRGPTPTTSRWRPCVETGDILLQSQRQSGDRGRGVLRVCR